MPAPNDVRRSAELVTLVAVNAERVESFRNWIAPNEPGVAPSAALITIEPAELNSSALFRELAIIVYYITGGYYRDCRFTYVENLLLIVLLLDLMSIFSNSRFK